MWELVELVKTKLSLLTNISFFNHSYETHH